MKYLLQLKFLSQEEFKYKVGNNYWKLDLDVLDELRKDKDLAVTKADKGNGIVILNKSDYTLKIK